MKKVFTFLVILFAMMAASVSSTAQEVTVSLIPGWNWISYPNAEAMQVGDALGGFTPVEGDIIQSQFASSKYINGRWRGGVTQFLPGSGYMFYSARTEDVEFVFAQPASNIVATAMPTGITATSAVAGGMVTLPEGSHVFLRGVCWGTMPNPDIDGDHTTEATGIGNFSSTLEGLNPNTTYFVRAYAVTDHGLTYGNELSFTTLSGIPVVTTAELTDVTTNNATCGGEITDDGGLEITARGVCWSTSYNPTIDDAHTTDGTGTGSFVSMLTGLNPNTTYYVRAYATNSIVTVYGERRRFTTESEYRAYVDLGLPSGTLWATCNVGADNPEDYGGYFDDFGERDVATDNWGIYWRMPTEAEFGELLGNTTNTWTTQNGVNGRLFTASNGNSIFLPATFGSEGSYWSSTHFSGFWYVNFLFDSDECFIGIEDVINGLSVRPVRSGSQITSNIIYIIEATADPVEGAGIVIGGTYTYEQGQVCTLAAIANTGYTFSNWTESGNVVSTNPTYTFTVNADRTLVANFTPSGDGGPYVDLGLPSGRLWAIRNVGAFAPWDYGDYFAWGEPHQLTDEGWDPFDEENTFELPWEIYQYCNGDYNQLTKYCNNSSYGYNGFTDDLTTLLPEDDAATANWGEGWCMPTIADWQELYNYTSHIWTTQNGVNGMLFTASNGNSLFLPASGYFEYGSILYGAPYDGCYWSSSLDTDGPYGAWALSFDSDNCRNSSDYRCISYSVRPVRVGSQNNAPTGAINGKFTINVDGDQVYFSQGNLQYIGSAATPYWKFADNQWDVLGATTGQNNSDQNIDRDLFGWGTSGYDHGAVCYQPWSTSQTKSDYYAYGQDTYYLYDQTGQADWGYNPISNGGNQASSGWRTLTTDEWNYLFNTRVTPSGIRYAKACVNNVNGMILLPDDWSTSYYTLNNTNSDSAGYSGNTISAEQWSFLEQSGVVFLPAAGYRYGTSVKYVGSYGYYWSASYYNSNNVYDVYFRDGRLVPQDYSYRYYGFSVRLARVAEN